MFTATRRSGTRWRAVRQAIGRLAQDVERERCHRAAPFGEGNERCRSDLAAHRVLPAGQRFEPDDVPAAKVHQRLERDPDVAMGECLLEIFRHQPRLERQHAAVDMGMRATRPSLI